MITFYKETNFKETLIGKIPKDWEIVKLKSRVDIETGKRIKGGALDKGTVASIGGEHLDNEGNIRWDGMKFIPEYFYKSLKQGKVRLGDILLVKDGATTGKVALVRSLRYKKVAVNEHVFVLRSKMHDLVNEFLFYFLFSKFGQIQIKTRFHGMIGGITKGDIETVLITLPPSEEQEAIVRILSTIDKAIQKTNEIIEKTKRLKKGLMQELLTKGIGHKEFKDTKIGRMPKEWKVMKLKDFLSEPIRNGYSPVCPSKPTGKWILSLSALSEDGFKPDQVKPAPLDDPKVDKFMLRDGDILVSRSNTRELVGLAAMYRGIPPNCSYPDLMMRVRVNKKLIDPYFLEQWLRHPCARYYLSSRARGTSGSMVKINQTILSELPVPYPPRTEQKKIAEILLIADKKLEVEIKAKEKLDRIKKALMNSLLTGKVRVRV